MPRSIAINAVKLLDTSTSITNVATGTAVASASYVACHAETINGTVVLTEVSQPGLGTLAGKVSVPLTLTDTTLSGFTALIQAIFAAEGLTPGPDHIYDSAGQLLA